jgi:hypothetical protein
VNEPLTHILAPVELSDAPGPGPQLAMQLASGAGSLVTLLYVDGRPESLQASGQLDAIACLHQVTLLPPRPSSYAPAFPLEPRTRALQRLHALREELAVRWPDVDVRVVWRRGDVVTESLAFIDEAGVDLVVVDASLRRAAGAMRELQLELLRRRPCHLLTAHSPQAVAGRASLWSRARWRSLLRRWRAALASADAYPRRERLRG